MPYRRNKPAATTGEAELRLGSQTSAVTYEIEGDAAALRPGGPALRGALCATPEIARAAFRAGEAALHMGGRTFRLSIIAHTAGSDVAYFDIRA